MQKAIRKTSKLWLIPIIASSLCFALSLRRAIWSDEAATIYRISLPWKQFLYASIHKDDAVHATYYAILKLLHFAVGNNLIKLRFFSGFCIGFAAFGFGKLLSPYFSRKKVLIGQLFFVALPSVLDYGTDARSYALSLALITWLSYLFLKILKKADKQEKFGLHLILFTALEIFATYIFIYNSLIGIALLCFILVTQRFALIKIFLFVESIVFTLTCPLFYLGSVQIKQIGWISRGFFSSIGDTLSVAFESRSWQLAVTCVLLFSLMVFFLIVTRLSMTPALRELFIWASFITVIPSMVLIFSSFIHPILTQRYLVPFTSGFALLILLAFTRMNRNWRTFLMILFLSGLFGASYFNFSSSGRDDWGIKTRIVLQHAHSGGAVMASSRFYEEVLVTQPIKGATLLRFPNSPKLPQGVRLPKIETLAANPSQVFIIPLTKVHPEDIQILKNNGYKLRASYKVGPGFIMEFQK